jgi:hypothetical protein
MRKNNMKLLPIEASMPELRQHPVALMHLARRQRGLAMANGLRRLVAALVAPKARHDIRSPDCPHAA